MSIQDEYALLGEIKRLRTENAILRQHQDSLHDECSQREASLTQERDTLRSQLAASCLDQRSEEGEGCPLKVENTTLRELVREANEADCYICYGWSERAEKALKGQQ